MHFQNEFQARKFPYNACTLSMTESQNHTCAQKVVQFPENSITDQILD